MTQREPEDRPTIDEVIEACQQWLIDQKKKHAKDDPKSTLFNNWENNQ